MVAMLHTHKFTKGRSIQVPLFNRSVNQTLGIIIWNSDRLWHHNFQKLDLMDIQQVNSVMDSHVSLLLLLV